MTNKLYHRLLLFSLLGTALWFFGNLYEAIVIAPNLLVDSVQKIHDWQSFFTLTNPVYFYIPITPIAAFILVFLYFKTAKDKIVLKKYLARAVIFVLPAFALGVYIITQINFNLFFADLTKQSNGLFNLSVLWNILNLVRMALLLVTLVNLFKAYIWTQKNHEAKG